MMLCQQHGHEVVALANLCPEAGAPDELDSFMFQTVGHQLVAAFAACAGLPLFRRRIGGASKHTASPWPCSCTLACCCCCCLSTHRTGAVVRA